MKILRLKIKGISPFLMDRFSEKHAEKLKKIVRRGAQKEEISKEETAENGTYRTKDRTIYIPAEHLEGALKNASKGKRVGKFSVRHFVAGSIRIFPEQISLRTKKISGIDSRTIVNSNVRPPARVMKHRAFVFPWQVDIEIQYLETHLDEKIIIDLLQEAGQRFGIGSYAPRCGGRFGMFKVIK